MKRKQKLRNGKRNILSGFFRGDFIIIIAVVMGLLFTNAVFTSDTSKPYDQEFDKQTIVTQTYNQGDPNALQMQTFRVKQCASNTAIDFLIDNSGSMQFGSKMSELKSALHLFADNFPLNGAIALQTYSENVQNRVLFSLFKSSKDDFLEEVDKMKPLTATHSRDAFKVAKKTLEEGMQKFPKHKFSLIFISDGIPETGVTDKACPGGQNSQFCSPHPQDNTACRCYDPAQDPTEIAAELKEQGIRIFTISFIDNTDSKFNAQLQTLMENVASSRNHYFPAPVQGDLTNIISQISSEICSEF